MKKFDKFIAPSFEDLDKLTFKLAKSIIESGKKHDRVVVLAKGGWSMARNLVDYLNIKIASSIQFISYQGMKRLDKPTLAQSLSVEGEIKGQTILVFDDVADSGETLSEAKKYLQGLGGRVDTAVLFLKPHSSIKPDFYSDTTSSWIVFPHEKREFIEEASRQWLSEGMSRDEVKKRLLKLGLPREQVEYFVSKEYTS